MCIRDSDLGTPLLPRAGNLVSVVVGMRRSGKTYRLFQEMRRLLDDGVPPAQMLYFNFEDDRLKPLTSAAVSYTHLRHRHRPAPGRHPRLLRPAGEPHDGHAHLRGLLQEQGLRPRPAVRRLARRGPCQGGEEVLEHAGLRLGHHAQGPPQAQPGRDHGAYRRRDRQDMHPERRHDRHGRFAGGRRGHAQGQRRGRSVRLRHAWPVQRAGLRAHGEFPRCV